MDAISTFSDHVVATRFHDLPDGTVRAAKVFILDTLGVGLAGSAGPMARELAAASAAWGEGAQARVWGSGIARPAAAAAMCNAYQVHNSEFDCVHEEAVVHAMTVVLPAAIAGAERARNIGGADLIAAITVGVDVAAGLGVAAATGLRFFRPATAGALGAAAALGKLMGFDQRKMINAFSIAYAQLCGTMQAHTEGSALLAMQMGFAARNAVVACDLAALGFDGPKNVLEGPFGYFKLFEPGGLPARVVRELGRRWFIAELAHKPFPSGRATHGIVEACLALRRAHRLAPDAIERVTARVPPLVHHLVGRAPHEEMQANYARLCAPYVAACALRRDGVRLEDFTPAAYRDAPTQDLARHVSIKVCDAGNPNALTPVELEIALRDGTRHATRIETVYGNPAKPLSRADHLAKFRSNCAAAARPLPPQNVERVIERVDRIEEIADVTELVDLLTPAAPSA
ncbi:MAG TPA: MmgE/PrpD family protein [Xanthobacteraceae bacterium]|jgi:2-methylcitrate dehydratase PrpD|nr:MmgE/PrpD family protein [Xanthobacteraceae bacterium]